MFFLSRLETHFVVIPLRAEEQERQNICLRHSKQMQSFISAFSNDKHGMRWDFFFGLSTNHLINAID